jgi:hypothetical protein
MTLVSYGASSVQHLRVPRVHNIIKTSWLVLPHTPTTQTALSILVPADLTDLWTETRSAATSGTTSCVFLYQRTNESTSDPITSRQRGRPQAHGCYRVPSRFSPATYKQLLDGTVQAIGELIGSNYVDHNFVASTDPVYSAAQASTNAAYADQGWQPPVLCLEPCYTRE